MTSQSDYPHKINSRYSTLNQIRPKALVTGTMLASMLAMSGCATSSLLESNDHIITTKQTLSEDQVIAFGRPAQALPKTPNATMVIVGEKNSYVLTQGGTEMTSLLSNLTQKNIHVDNDMNFYVPNNDGHFQGEMKLSYAKLKTSLDAQIISSFYKIMPESVPQPVINVLVPSVFVLMSP